MIPRAHLPTMGTVGRINSGRDGFSITTNDDRHNDASDSYPSGDSATIYNPTYRTSGAVEEPVFAIFDDLERHRPLGRASIPRAQMLGMAGTLSSFPHNQMDDSFGGTNTFSDSNELDEIELVTDMLDDMTKDDYMPDDFIEALNPNLIIPRAVLQPEIKSSRWFSVC